MTDEYALSLIRDAGLEWFEHQLGGFVAKKSDFFFRITSSGISIANGFKRFDIMISPRSFFNKEILLLEKIFLEIRNQATNQCIERYSEEHKTKIKKEFFAELTEVLQQ